MAAASKHRRKAAAYQRKALMAKKKLIMAAYSAKNNGGIISGSGAWRKPASWHQRRKTWQRNIKSAGSIGSGALRVT